VRVAELVGLPGSGKSTIFEAILSRDDGIATIPILRHRPYRRVLARHLATTLATLVRRRALGHHWSFELVVMMAYLRAVLDGPHRPRGKALLFDQGPIYTLARPALRDERLAGWWERTLATWRSRLDVVIVLDAPDHVLLERITARDKEHRLKGHSRTAALQALADDRAVHDAVLDRFAGGPEILRVDTGRRSAEEIADEVLAVTCPS
jgi:adenylate kinase family enzyme